MNGSLVNEFCLDWMGIKTYQIWNWKTKNAEYKANSLRQYCILFTGDLRIDLCQIIYNIILSLTHAYGLEGGTLCVNRERVESIGILWLRGQCLVLPKERQSPLMNILHPNRNDVPAGLALQKNKANSFPLFLVFLFHFIWRSFMSLRF